MDKIEIAKKLNSGSIVWVFDMDETLLAVKFFLVEGVVSEINSEKYRAKFEGESAGYEVVYDVEELREDIEEKGGRLVENPALLKQFMPTLVRLLRLIPSNFSFDSNPVSPPASSWELSLAQTRPNCSERSTTMAFQSWSGHTGLEDT